MKTLDYSFWADEEERFWDAIEDLVLEALTAGVVGGLGLIPEDLSDPLNMELVDDEIMDFMRSYHLDTFAKISLTTILWATAVIKAWREDGSGSLDELRTALKDVVLSKNRAEMIAISEVTRLFAMGNELVWAAAGLMIKIWETAKDELVCPVCAPLDGQYVFFAMNFAGGIRNPPAHPRCRCRIRPALFESLIVSQLIRGIG
jgi:SPP1 gp7 family putative phage head morphogenesis protein